jgi:hypothetical protein
VILGEIFHSICSFNPRSNVILGAVEGSIVCLAWVGLNTYTATVLGDFQIRYPQCHNISDMARVVGDRPF